MRSINVLLISPRLPAGHPKYGGDHAYTETLLKYPPRGVLYHHYEDLLAEGKIRRIKNFYRIGPRLVKMGILPPDLWAEYLYSDFIPDLVHVVGFSATIRFPRNAGHIPVVIEAPCGSVSDLMVRFGWPEQRIIRAHRIKRLYLKLVGAYDSGLSNENASLVLVQSEYSRRLHIEYGYVNSVPIEVLPPAIPDPIKSINITLREQITFLFVGSDFERKNGQLVIDAFQRVHSNVLDSILILISRPASGQQFNLPGIFHYISMARKDLFESIYPISDILVFPTKAEGGFGVVIFEAMKHGLAVISVDAWAIPEIVINGQNGILVPYPPNIETVTDAMSEIASDRELLLRMRNSSFLRANTVYSIAERQNKLGEIYRKIVGR